MIHVFCTVNNANEELKGHRYRGKHRAAVHYRAASCRLIMLHHTHTHACVPVGDWQVFLNEKRVGHVVWVVATVEGQLARGSTVLHVHIKHKVKHLCRLLTEQ